MRSKSPNLWPRFLCSYIIVTVKFCLHRMWLVFKPAYLPHMRYTIYTHIYSIWTHCTVCFHKRSTAFIFQFDVVLTETRSSSSSKLKRLDHRIRDAMWACHFVLSNSLISLYIFINKYFFLIHFNLNIYFIKYLIDWMWIRSEKCWNWSSVRSTVL